MRENKLVNRLLQWRCDTMGIESPVLHVRVPLFCKVRPLERRDVKSMMKGIVERQVMQPESFSCVACGLKIAGYSKLLASGLGDTYISTSHYDALEYFEVDLDEHIRSMMEDDNNEY